ncbi:MAG: aldehyde ferredoxin oxidoreductase family protein [Candidatus Bathyarchaeota archaeon]|nr:MAG: aldehyde ferredoxin oxidoreductase family protein [Candidatus Bathyarchaeota archaeon]
MQGGYVGKILRVDLSREKTSSEDLNTQWARMFIGGKGLGAKYLFEELKPNTDPLSPENVMIIMTGPLTGTTAPCASRYAVLTKSPLTGAFLDCYVGGYLGAELKFAGFDAAIITGKAEKPTYLWIADGKAEFKDAKDLSGLDIHETEKRIKEDLEDKEVKVAAIGPAGENLAKMACITVDLYRHAGRGGAGAVMGSKNLKAVAVRGHQSISVPKIEDFIALSQEITKDDVLTPDNEWAKIDGTPGFLRMVQEAGILPTRNFQMGVFEHVNKIDEVAIKKILVRRRACYGCPLGCGNLTQVKEGPFAGTIVEGPEYETLAMAGANCYISDLAAIAKYNLLCDQLGLDTISTGDAIAFAMECYERGIITEKDTNGLELTFGNVEAYIEMPKLIAYRESIGDILAEGVSRAAEKIGKGSGHFTVHAKRLEYPGYDPRGSIGMALAYAVSDRGACHLRAWPANSEAFGDLDPFTTEGKAQLVIDDQNLYSVKWSLVVCDFYAIGYPNIARLCSAATGWNLKEEDVKIIGERVWNQTRQFNVREGISRENDTLPERISKDPLKGGRAEGHVVARADFDKMLGEYYQLRGWDEEGRPRKEKLKALELVA